MYAIIYGNLDRQTRALALLHSLLFEEYDLLRQRATDEVMPLEMSIQELLRQITVEKQEVRRLLGGGKLLDYAAMLPEEDGAELRDMFRIIDSYEQECARQASRNADLSLALLDMSKQTTQFLYSNLVPPIQNTYGRKGSYVEGRYEAALISGRL